MNSVGPGLNGLELGPTSFPDLRAGKLEPGACPVQCSDFSAPARFRSGLLQRNSFSGVRCRP